MKMQVTVRQPIRPETVQTSGQLLSYFFGGNPEIYISPLTETTIGHFCRRQTVLDNIFCLKYCVSLHFRVGPCIRTNLIEFLIFVKSRFPLKKFL